jgi:hypothetical protein
MKRIRVALHLTAPTMAYVKRVSRVRYNKQTIPQDKFVGKISMTYILVTNSEVI